MSTRKASLFLLVIIFEVTTILFVRYGWIGPFWFTAAAFVLVAITVGGLVLAILSQANDATAFLQGLFSREAQKEKAARDYKLNSPDNERNRENIICNVHHAWIRGVLSQALHKKVTIELDLEFEPTALTRELEIWEGQPVHRSVPDDMSISDVFDETGQALLILGEPGSGKTITLLELCRDLLERADREAQVPVPVVLNLSTWATNPNQPLHEWIVEQIHRRYQLIQYVGRIWLESNQVCLLLDGLDEVALKVRDECVQAINAFRGEYNAPIVVCSRTEEYNKLAERLNLSTAVVIQPLDEDKVTAYLTHKKLKLKAVHEAVLGDDALRELSRTPLMLNVMALAYGGISRKELRPLMQDVNGRRRHLYNAYIERMFRRRPLQNVGYEPQLVLMWLSFLALQLTNHGETEFFLENLQLDWLSNISKRRFQLTLSFSVFIISWLVGTLALQKYTGIGRAVFVNAFAIFVTIFVANSEQNFNSQPVEAIRWQFPYSGIHFVLITGLFIGLITGLFMGLNFGLYLGLVLVFLTGLLDGVIPTQSAPRTMLNHGIRRSAVNAICGGLVIGLGIGLGGLMVIELDVALYVAIFSGLAVGLRIFGGNVVITHYSLRLMLHRCQLLPIRLVQFLSAMTVRLILQDAGAHFRFVHRSLQEHFAALTPADINRLAQAVDGAEK